MWYKYTMEYHSAITKNEIILFGATWMDTDIIILSEIKQTEKDKYHMISLMCGIKKKDIFSLFTKQKEPHRFKEQTYSYQRKWWREGIDCEFRTDMHTLLFSK